MKHNKCVQMVHQRNNTLKVKTSDLIGPALDWAVAKCEGCDYHSHECTYATDGSGKVWAAGTCPSEDRYSTRWSQGGPIIDEMMKGASFFIENDGGNVHVAFSETRHLCSSGYGPTTLIAAMRCYVASELGDEVEVPDELLEK